MFQVANKVAALGFLIFIGLWSTGILRGLTLPYPPPAPLSIPSSLGRDNPYFSSRDNFANNLKHLGLIDTPLPLVLDNPGVEKIRIIDKKALLTLGTTAFDQDEIAVRSATDAYQATIFNEKKSGIEPARELLLEIGVHPDKFDGLVDRLRSIGKLSTISVEQKDRTGEFRKLNAQRLALKKYLASISKLRETKNPTFEDSLRLEQKIQDIEKELQALSVQFDDLLGKESFYHVHLSLVEYQPGSRRDHTYTIPERIYHAFAWAVTWWFAVALAIGIVTASWISVRVLWRRPSV